MSNLDTDENYVERSLSCDKKNNNRSASAMFLYLRELFFLFALVFTSYTALFNSMPKVSKPPTPVPFFPKNSIVVDHYKGTVNAAFQRASEVDLTVVMYYAPWDAESQSARFEFEAAAQFLHEEVYFTAISCWSPNTECKQHLPRIRHFPIIVAYPQHSKGIHYQGPIKSVYLINFIKSLMRPIRRILSPVDIVRLTGIYNVLLVGSFIFNGNLGGPGYHTFYSAATKMLEKDPFHEIAFAITTDNEMAAAIDFESVPSIRLYLWNETFDYPPDADYSDESLVKWVWYKMNQVVQWVSPPKVKSHLLSPYISRGPALILFTPRNPLFGVNPMYSLLREIAFRYYNCNNSTWVTHLSDYIELRNQELRLSRSKLEKYCMKRRKEMEFLKSSLLMPSVIVPNSLINSSEFMKKEDTCDPGSLYSKYLGPQSEVCFRRSKVNHIYFNSFHRKSYDSSFFFDLEDEKSPEKLLYAWEEDRCKSLEHGEEYFKLPYPKFFKFNFNESFDGLACVNNRTLSIIAMDSLSHYQFAEGLGINILHRKDRTAVAIIDKSVESQFILKEEVSKNSLMSFIANHTKNTLKRFLRSSHDLSARTTTRHRYPVRHPENCTHTDVESCVPELNSKNFLDYVLNQSRAVLVFYHTPYCALCRSISHLFLLLSRYFRYFPDIKFARIDGDNNDLPWEYTMDLFPALLFFPTFRYKGQLPNKTAERHDAHRFSVCGDGDECALLYVSYCVPVREGWHFDGDLIFDLILLLTDYEVSCYLVPSINLPIQNSTLCFRKSESRLYSKDLPFTIRNLIHFVLGNLEPEARIPAMISLCLSFEKLQNENEARKCKSKVQKECYENLSKTLKDVRRTINRWKNMASSSEFMSDIRQRKKILLFKLEYFKNIHFILGSVEKLQLNSKAVTDVIKLYQKFLLLIRSNSYYLNYDGFR